MSLRVVVPREARSGETRAAATPETVKRLIKLGAPGGIEVEVEAGLGVPASFPDEAYRAAGATVTDRPGLEGAGAVLRVGPPSAADCARLAPGTFLAGLLAPYREDAVVRALAERGVTAIALELLPRITRAQPMDALSSQASVAGYKAVLLAASRLGKHFPLLMTAAGTIPPARVVVMGAGVAGLQAIATARRLGAVIEVSDIRPAVKEQVESLGGKFIELPQVEAGEGSGGYAKELSAEALAKQRQILTERVAQADVVITTALVPGRPAPRLVSREMVEAMRPGALIVDLAAEQGGNCELSKIGEEVSHRGVTILAPANLATTVAADASTLYARNLFALVQYLWKDGALRFDESDELVAGCLLTHGGEIRHPPTRDRLSKTQTA
jgi:NAD(P) transhydrogenase subunit alpha